MMARRRSNWCTSATAAARATIEQIIRPHFEYIPRLNAQGDEQECVYDASSLAHGCRDCCDEGFAPDAARGPLLLDHHIIEHHFYCLRGAL